MGRSAGSSRRDLGVAVHLLPLSAAPSFTFMALSCESGAVLGSAASH